MYDSDNLKQESKERIKTKVHLKQTLTEKGQFDPKSNMSLFFLWAVLLFTQVDYFAVKCPLLEL